ncbi:MAG TPA: MarR family winged helix-turn-helix transcriptional regulator [Candidatus Acidoferrales bacterium]|nr:MarR family winged helix-turn-helix transcriptional regulator [Candidatus Acidoferrales bacterium]
MDGGRPGTPLGRDDRASSTQDGDARMRDAAALSGPSATRDRLVDLIRTHLSDGEFRAWRTYLQSHALLLRRLEADLVGETGMSLAHYDVLVQLALADGRRLRMHELAERVLLSRSGITRVVDRLEADGLVERRVCQSDARGSFAVLSEAGLTQLHRATPVHFAGVRRHFVGPLRATELEALADLLERLVAAQGSSAPDAGRRPVRPVPGSVAAG